MVAARGTAVVSAPGTAYGLFLVTSVVPMVLPVVPMMMMGL